VPIVIIQPNLMTVGMRAIRKAGIQEGLVLAFLPAFLLFSNVCYRIARIVAVKFLALARSPRREPVPISPRCAPVLRRVAMMETGRPARQVPHDGASGVRKEGSSAHWADRWRNRLGTRARKKTGVIAVDRWFLAVCPLMLKLGRQSPVTRLVSRASPNFSRARATDIRSISTLDRMKYVPRFADVSSY
jgi:hypothetical protein